MDLQTRKTDLWNLAMSEGADLYEIAAMVSTIPDTTAAIVRFANTATVGQLRPVGTVLEAVARVGTRVTAGLAMASLNDDLGRSFGSDTVSEVSLTVARAARVIARLRGYPHVDAERLFVAGLFSSAGIHHLASQHDDYESWRDQLRMLGRNESQLLREEQLTYGVSHDTLSARLLNDWNLPPSICAAVASHHHASTIDDQIVRASIAALANDSVQRCVDLTFDEAMRSLGLGEHVESVLSEASLHAIPARADSPVPTIPR